MKTYSHFMGALSLFAASLALTGCDQRMDVMKVGADSVSLALLGGPLTGPLPPNCVLTTTNQNLRILFMVDNSGSTNTTDPQKNYRIAAMSQFLDQFRNKTNLTYSLGIFTGTSAYLWKMSGSPSRASAGVTPAPLFGDSSVMNDALTDFGTNYASGGNTPYEAAFSLLTSAVQADLTSGNTHNYMVLFLSDGQPNPALAGTSDGELAAAKQLVDNLASAATSGGSLLTVSSVYFGPAPTVDNPEPAHAISLMQAISQEGKGQFVDTNTLNGGNFTVADVLTVPCAQ